MQAPCNTPAKTMTTRPTITVNWTSQVLEVDAKLARDLDIVHGQTITYPEAEVLLRHELRLSQETLAKILGDRKPKVSKMSATPGA